MRLVELESLRVGFQSLQSRCEAYCRFKVSSEFVGGLANLLVYSRLIFCKIFLRRLEEVVLKVEDFASWVCDGTDSLRILEFVGIRWNRGIFQPSWAS